MRVIIAGGRNIKYFSIENAVKKSGFNITTLINGKCKGIDRLAEEWAISNSIPVDPYPVTKEEWKRLGKKAGPLRNKKMANADAFGLILIWDGKSKGSKSMKEEAEKAGLFIYEIVVNSFEQSLFD